MAKAAFYTGSAAHDADDRIIFDPLSHKLYYDPDGTGAQVATEFADLYGSNLRLTYSDFVVVG